MLAAFLELVLPGSTCESALPPTDLDGLLVELLRRTVEAFLATAVLVDLVDLVAIDSLRDSLGFLGSEPARSAERDA